MTTQLPYSNGKYCHYFTTIIIIGINALCYNPKLREYLVETGKRKKIFLIKTLTSSFSNFVTTCINPLKRNDAEWLHLLKQIGSKWG